MVNDGANDYFYLHDHLYSTVALVNSAGAVVERYEYDAYGKVSILSPNYELRTTTSVANPYLFAGYRFDANTGLYHTLYRSYDPYTGRWLQHDPLGYIDSMSLYEYVMSNPMGYTDPWGLVSKGEFRESIEQTRQAYAQVQEALQRLGVMALNGNGSESELYAQVAAIEGLYNQYRSQQNEMMSTADDFYKGQWWVSWEDYRLMSIAFDLSMQDPANHLINPGSDILSEAQTICCNLCNSTEKVANRTNVMLRTAQVTETTCTVASAVGGVSLLGKEAAKLGLKKGAAYLAKQAAVIAMTQVVATAIVSEAEEMGFTETQIRMGIAAFEILAMHKAFQGKKGCVETKGQFRDSKGRLRNANGTFAYDGGPKLKVQNTVHGNSINSPEEATLYGKFDSDDNFLKWGVSQDVKGGQQSRYSQDELNGGYLKEYRRGPRIQMLDKERKLVERFPGPDNNERWAGWRNPKHPKYRGKQ